MILDTNAISDLSAGNPALSHILSESIRHHLPVIVLGEYRYATISYELKEKGKPIPENDIWICALCRQHKLEIASRDNHFDCVEGVTRISW